MEKKSINKAMEIKAGKEKVWEVLTQQPFLNEWNGAFMAGLVI